MAVSGNWCAYQVDCALFLGSKNALDSGSSSIPLMKLAIVESRLHQTNTRLLLALEESSVCP